MTTTIQDLLQLEWKDLEPKIRQEINEVLNPGPWEHDWATLDDTCFGCGMHRKSIANKTPCLVPPPITDPPEVVAEKLLLYIRGNHIKPDQMETAYRKMWSVYERSIGWQFWWIFYSTPAQRVLCCLLALGKLNCGGEMCG